MARKRTPAQRFMLILLLSSFFLFFIGTLQADEKQEAKNPRMAFGIGLMYGLYDLSNPGSGIEGVDSIHSGGAGLIYENMIGASFGIHSGLWYQYTNYFFEGDGELSTSSIMVPFYLMYVFRHKDSKLGILAGFNFMQILDAEYHDNNRDIDVLKYLNYQQAGIAAGIEVTGPFTYFTDFYFSIIAERYLTNFTGEDASESGPNDKLYGITIKTGVLLRTF